MTSALFSVTRIKYEKIKQYRKRWVWGKYIESTDLILVSKESKLISPQNYRYTFTVFKLFWEKLYFYRFSQRHEKGSFRVWKLEKVLSIFLDTNMTHAAFDDITHAAPLTKKKRKTNGKKRKILSNGEKQISLHRFSYVSQRLHYTNVSVYLRRLHRYSHSNIMLSITFCIFTLSFT